MQRILVVLAVLAAVVQANSLSHGWNDKIDWVTLQDGIQQSAAMGKPIMLVVHKSWCGACKNLKPLFANSAEIESLSSQFVMVNTLDDEEPQGELYAPDGGYIPRIMFYDAQQNLINSPEAISGNPKYKHFFSSAEQIVEAMKFVSRSAAKSEL
jgi:protein-disulfide reductase (glutathione)